MLFATYSVWPLVMKSFPLLLASVCLLGAGCSKEPERPPTYPVTGVVKMKDRPLEGARVTFVPTTAGIEAASGVTDAEGKYALTTFSQGDGAQPGSYRVKVAKYDTKGGVTPAPDAPVVSYEEESKLEFAPDEKPHPVARSILPKKYDSEISSGLTHTVPEGPSTFDIKIE
jgi:hypothetical protein